MFHESALSVKHKSSVTVLEIRGGEVGGMELEVTVKNPQIDT